jgi:hypothetical protein
MLVLSLVNVIVMTTVLLLGILWQLVFRISGSRITGTLTLWLRQQWALHRVSRPRTPTANAMHVDSVTLCGAAAQASRWTRS